MSRFLITVHWKQCLRLYGKPWNLTPEIMAQLLVNRITGEVDLGEGNFTGLVTNRDLVGLD